jgi:RNA polymerase sigma factor (sigma-70 family)
MARKLNTMPTSPLSVVIQHLLADLRPDGDGMTDGELLARFVRSRGEDALAALVRRHASMVWGVCRRLHNHHDAEDAFQATFLVLVRKAASVPGQAVANWLYGVARQTAVRVQATAAKRGRRETQVVNMPEPAMPEVRDADLQSVVDEELSRLPDHYRGVVILCDLEGMTRKEAARQLRIPEGSVASRLARARALLAKRLSQRGIVFSGGSAVAVLSAGSASSAPPALVASTIKVASLLAAGQAAGVVSVKVAALTEGVVKAMFVFKLKAAISVVLMLGVMATGATFLTYHTAVGQEGKKPPVAKPSEEKSVELPNLNAGVKADPAKVPLMTPKEIKAKMDLLYATPGSRYWDGPVETEFGVNSVAWQTFIVSDELEDQKRLALVPDGDATRFTVQLMPEVQTALKRLGIVDLEAHFRGKFIRIRGHIGVVSTNFALSPSIHSYHLLVNNLDQIVEVKDTGKAEGSDSKKEKSK